MKHLLQYKATAFLFFTVLAVLSYWQIALLHNSLLNDMIDCYLPWRTFVADCIANHNFPFWCPYQETGFPIHADMRSVLSPEYWLSGIALGKYTNYTLHFFFIFYIVIAGYGMHRLSLYLGASRTSSVLAGTAFMLSGYIVSQGQDISSTAGMAWLPFAILFYLKLLQNFSFQNIYKTAVFQFLLITGAYPAITIILQYLLATFFIVLIIKYLKNRNLTSIKKLILSNALLYFIILLLCSFYIISYYYSKDYIDRFHGLDISKASNTPFSPQSLISLLLPFSTVKSLDFFATDISLNNIYIGIVCLVFFFVTFVRKTAITERILLVFGLICLLAAFGLYTPVRELTFYLPLMSMFRITSFFRPFVILALVLSASLSITAVLNNVQHFKKALIYISLSIIAMLIGAIAYSIPHLTSSSFPFLPIKATFLETLAGSDIYGHICIQSALQIGILIVLIIIAIKFSTRKYLKYIIGILVCVDLFLSVQLNAYYTVVSQHDAFTIHKHIEAQPRVFPIPELNAIADNTERSSSIMSIWRNTNIFTKNICPRGYNPFVLRNYNTLIDTFPQLFDKITQNAVLYFSHTLKPIDSLKTNKKIYTKETVFLQNENYVEISSRVSDSEIMSEIQLLKFSPNSIKASVNTDKLQLLNFIQGSYPGWKCFIDGRECKIYSSNLHYMAVLIPSGRHSVEFRYFNKPVWIGFLLSYGTFIILLILIAGGYLFSRFEKRKAFYIFLIIVLCSICIGYYWITKPTKSELADKEYVAFAKTIPALVTKYGAENIQFLLNCDRTDFLDSLLNHNKNLNISELRLKNYSRLGELSEIVKRSNKKYFVYFCNKLRDPEEVDFIIQQKFPTKLTNRYFASGREAVFSIDGQKGNRALCEISTDFLQTSEWWLIPNGLKYDTTLQYRKRKVFEIDSTNTYSNSLNINSLQLKPFGRISKLVVSANFFTVDPSNSAFIVFKHKQPGCGLREWYLPLHEYSKTSNTWYNAVFVIDLDLKYSNSESLQVFIWNQGGKKLLVENLELRFY